jgi:uncharacterized damage-inducible protein DinB
MTAVDLKAHLRDATVRAHRLLTNDLKALDHTTCLQCPSEKARSAVHIVAECAAVNGMIATYLETGEFNRPSPEEREAHLSSFHTPEKVLDYLDHETHRLLAVFETLDLETLSEPCNVLGRPMTRFALAELPIGHMMYHDGQINYIQTLYGDTDMHW